MLIPNLLPNNIILLIVISSIYFLLFNRDLVSFCYGINNNYVKTNYKLGLEFNNKLKNECINTFKFEKINSLKDFYRFQEFQKIITKYMFNKNINIDLLYKEITKNDEIYVVIFKLRLLEITMIIIYISSLYIIFIVLPIILINCFFIVITKIIYLILISLVIVILLKNINQSFDIYEIISNTISYYYNEQLKIINNYIT